jgi:hypothetical protein
MNPPDPSRLASLLDVSEPGTDWTSGELASILQHQLEERPDSLPRTLRQTLLDPAASLEELGAIRHWAKVRRAAPGSGVPADIFRVVYFAAIAKARLGGHQISGLTSAELDQGLNWARALPWIDDELRSLFARASGGGR